jgi:hypothetical protein
MTNEYYKNAPILGDYSTDPQKFIQSILDCLKLGDKIVLIYGYNLDSIDSNVLSSFRIKDKPNLLPYDSKNENSILEMKEYVSKRRIIYIDIESNIGLNDDWPVIFRKETSAQVCISGITTFCQDHPELVPYKYSFSI